MAQAELAKKWCSKSSKVSETVTAANLYTGRGYRKLVSRIPEPKAINCFNRIGIVDLRQ